MLHAVTASQVNPEDLRIIFWLLAANVGMIAVTAAIMVYVVLRLTDSLNSLQSELGLNTPEKVVAGGARHARGRLPSPTSAGGTARAVGATTALPMTSPPKPPPASHLEPARPTGGSS